MEKELKNKIKEFVDLSKECPDNLQQLCFELLLKNYLENINFKKIKREENVIESNKEEMQNHRKDSETQKQEDILDTDLHIKVKRFLKTYSLSIDHLNQIFYKENNSILPLYEDLKTTKISESQIKISLLNSLLNAIKNGDFEFDGEIVRQQCIERKCYDVDNFAAIFKTNSTLFEKFKAYDKKSSKIALSNEGKLKLANLIKELQ